MQECASSANTRPPNVEQAHRYVCLNDRQISLHGDSSMHILYPEKKNIYVTETFP